MSKSEKPNKKNKLIYIILGSIMLVLLLAIIGNNIKKAETQQSTSIYEAQTKCMLMEEADIVNYMGEPFGEETTKKAEKFCLSQWDKRQNSDNSEEDFIKIIEMDWAERKTEILEGYTLEQLYTESIK